MFRNVQPVRPEDLGRVPEPDDAVLHCAAAGRWNRPRRPHEAKRNTRLNICCSASAMDVRRSSRPGAGARRSARHSRGARRRVQSSSSSVMPAFIPAFMRASSFALAANIVASFGGVRPSLRKARGMERRVAHLPWSWPRALSGPAGALRRSIAALFGHRGRAFRRHWRRPSANRSRGVVVPPGGSPAPPESRACEARGAGAASCSAVRTPPEAPSTEQDYGHISKEYDPVKRAKASRHSARPAKVKTPAIDRPLWQLRDSHQRSGVVKCLLSYVVGGDQ
jgi:hypothetical protein